MRSPIFSLSSSYAYRYLPQSMIKKLFNLPSNERKTFARHFLSSVNCELAFTGGDMNSLTSNIESFKSWMAGVGFNENKEIIENHVALHANNESGETAKIEQNTSTTGYAFRNPETQVTFDIYADKIIISTSNYSGFDSFIATLTKIVNQVGVTFGSRDVTKVGLKKINSIAMEGIKFYEEACSIFNPALFALLRSGLPSSSVKMAQEVLLIENENSASLLRNSFRALDNAHAYEATLDFDIVSRKSTSAEIALNETLFELNSLHFDLFKWAVTEKMIKLMNSEGN